MKSLITIIFLMITLTVSAAENPLIQCDAKVPGYQRFRVLMTFDNPQSPLLHLFVIQGGMMGHWRVRGINDNSDETHTRTKFMMNENDFAVLSMPNEIFDGEYNQNFDSSLEMMNAKYSATCFTVQ